MYKNLIAIYLIFIPSIPVKANVDAEVKSLKKIIAIQQVEIERLKDRTKNLELKTGVQIASTGKGNIRSGEVLFILGKLPSGTYAMKGKVKVLADFNLGKKFIDIQMIQNGIKGEVVKSFMFDNSVCSVDGDCSEAPDAEFEKQFTLNSKTNVELVCSGRSAVCVNDSSVTNFVEIRKL